MDYTCQLPIELFIPIIFLSFDTPDPVQRIIRTEELRLVNRAWRAAIDSTPVFWACIPNEANSFPRTVQGWIQKSGQVPLHTLCTKIDPVQTYMQLVSSHSHRWRKLEIVSCESSISQYLSEPTPMLETLIISHSSFYSAGGGFGGTIPSLSSVHLVGVALPETPNFLRNLRELRLQRVQYPSREIPIIKLYDILEACPDLEQLELDGCYTKHPFERPPVLLAQLRSFDLKGRLGPPECKDAIIGMILAARLAQVYLQFAWNWCPRLNALSPLSAKLLLRERAKYNISISDGRFILSTVDGRENAQGSPSMIVDHPTSKRIGLKLLRSFEKTVPSSSTVDIVFDQSRSTRTIFKYLKSIIGGVDGATGDPLPQLRSILLNIDRASPYSYQDLLMDVAQVRRDVPRIRIHNSCSQTSSENKLSQWDPATLSFVSI